MNITNAPQLVAFLNLAGPDLVLLLIPVVMIAIPLWATSRLDKRLHAKQPNVRPFKWGYWMGMSCFLAPLIVSAKADGDGAVFLILAIIFIPIGIFVLLRHRWALVTATVLSLNPILWIVNAIYIRNRWTEMASSNSALQSQPVSPKRTIARELLDERSAPLPPPPPPTQDQTSKFFLHIGSEAKGPFTIEQIRGIISVGTASLNTQCCKEGTQEWRPVSAFV